MSSQRLQKVLAQAGIASRRAAEILITEGRVRVNGRIVRELGARANPDKDRVEVDGRRLVAERHVYFLLHKPREVVTTLDDPEGRKTVKDLLRNVTERVFPVGRLDFQTSGALLLTNDGELAQALLHQSRAVPKTYNAKLEGVLDASRLELLRSGVTLDDGHKTAPAEVQIIRTDPKFTSVEITISEGKNRQIHRMGEAVDRTVLRLTRLAFAGLTIAGLRAGHLRPLTPRELFDLKEAYLHKPSKRRGSPRAYGETELAQAKPLFSVGDELPPPIDSRTTPRRAPARRRTPARTPAPAPARGARTARAAKPRNDRSARTQSSQTTRSRPSKTKRGQTPRSKTPFKR
jgi:23S rRNA pseudouridine2605 synthase